MLEGPRKRSLAAPSFLFPSAVDVGILWGSRAFLQFGSLDFVELGKGLTLSMILMSPRLEPSTQLQMALRGFRGKAGGESRPFWLFDRAPQPPLFMRVLGAQSMLRVVVHR